MTEARPSTTEFVATLMALENAAGRLAETAPADAERCSRAAAWLFWRVFEKPHEFDDSFDEEFVL